MTEEIETDSAFRLRLLAVGIRRRAVSIATGEDLDHIGSIYGLQRKGGRFGNPIAVAERQLREDGSK